MLASFFIVSFPAEDEGPKIENTHCRQGLILWQDIIIAKYFGWKMKPIFHSLFWKTKAAVFSVKNFHRLSKMFPFSFAVESLKSALSQLTFTCSRSTIETPKKVWNMFFASLGYREVPFFWCGIFRVSALHCERQMFPCEIVTLKDSYRRYFKFNKNSKERNSIM